MDDDAGQDAADRHDDAGRAEDLPNDEAGHQDASDTATPAQRDERQRAWRTRKQQERARRERLISERQEREAKEDAAVTLVLSGMSYRTAGKRMGLTKSQVERLYRAGINRPSDDSPDDFRQLTNTRLERLLQASWLPAVQGDVKATAVCLSIIDIMAKFNGQYPAIGIDLTATLTARVQSDESEVLRLLAERQADRLLAIPARTLELGPSGNGADGTPNGNEP